MAAFLVAVLTWIFTFATSADFWGHVAISYSRVALGVALGIAYAVSMIALAQAAGPVSRALFGFNSAIRYAPPTAFLGIIIILFGLGGEAAVALICLGTAPYLLIMFSDTLAQRPEAYKDFVKLYKVGPLLAL